MAQLTAVVTGAGGGIGGGTVAALAARGFRVACLDRNLAAAERVAKAAGPQHAAYEIDVADEQSVIATFQKIKSDLGSIDGLATCAGVLETTPFMEVPVGAFHKVYGVNLIGTYLCIRESVPLMKEGSRICTIGSISGIRGGGFLGTVAYSSSKGAVNALTKVAARELADKGIVVNMVSPGGVQTEMTKTYDKTAPAKPSATAPLLKRMAAPHEMGAVVAWMLSPEASFVVGANLVADGGLLLL